MNTETMFYVWVGALIIDLVYGYTKKGNIFWTIFSFCPGINIILAVLIVSSTIRTTLERKAV